MLVPSLVGSGIDISCTLGYTDFVYGYLIRIVLVFVKYRRYYVISSHFYRFVSEIFLYDYEVRHVIGSDIDALKARIEFVQSKEVSSMYGVIM